MSKLLPIFEVTSAELNALIVCRYGFQATLKTDHERPANVEVIKQSCHE